jgi:hypothetical protein
MEEVPCFSNRYSDIVTLTNIRRRPASASFVSDQFICQNKGVEEPAQTLSGIYVSSEQHQ